jgi:ATP-binding cassette subfamily E protein 1
LEDNLKAIIKPQYVDHIPKAVKGVVGEIMANKNEKKIADSVIIDLDLTDVQGRQVGDLSGGELQRFAIAVSVIQKADVYELVASLFCFYFCLFLCSSPNS